LSAAAIPGLSRDAAPEAPGDGRELPGDGREPPDDQLSGLVDGEFVEETTPATPTDRRSARAVAVQALYESDVAGHPGLPAVRLPSQPAHLSAGLEEFAKTLVSRVERDRASLDARIAEAAPAFPIDQLAAVDRNILRLALAEMEGDPDTPASVVVNEAVEAAKLFGSESTPAFVNGVLGSMLR